MPWKVGGEKVLLAKLTNQSDRSLWLFVSTPLGDYNLSVTDAAGRVVRMSENGLRLKEGQETMSLHTKRQVISRQATYTTWINLHEFYDLGPGKYKAHVRLATFGEDNFDFQLNRPIPRKESDVPLAALPFEVVR